MPTWLRECFVFGRSPGDCPKTIQKTININYLETNVRIDIRHIFTAIGEYVRAQIGGLAVAHVTALARQKWVGERRRDTRKKEIGEQPKDQQPSEVPNEVFPKKDQAVSHEVRPQRVLIAEDNKVTQGLLKLLLNQRGHQVDIVGNGEDALTALEKDAYDVVLMDFHLPKMDGLKVATTFRIGHSTGAQPRFVAITADMEGLLGHVDNCENFDSILPKPFDLERVCQVVEGEAEEILVPCETPAVTPAPDLSMLERQSKNSPVSAAANHIQNLQHAFLRWPNDFDGARLSDEHLQAALDDAGRFDAVLVCEAASPLEMTMLWSTKSLHVLPVIDLTGTLGAHADLDGANLSFGEADKIAELINDFHNQRIRSAFRRALHRRSECQTSRPRLCERPNDCAKIRSSCRQAGQLQHRPGKCHG